MQFRILGPLDVADNGHPIDLGGPRQRALLALLLLNANEVVTRDRLIDELWGEEPPASAVKTLQANVSRLRGSLNGREGASGPGAGRLETHGQGYLLRVEPGELDADRFRTLLEEAKRDLARGEPGTASETLREGLGLWRGPPLADLSQDSFARAEIGRLDELRLAGLEERIDADLALGRHTALVGELESLVSQHPLRERLRGATHARALSLGPAGGGPARLPGRPPDACRGARARAQREPAPPRTTDPRAGRGAGAAAAAVATAAGGGAAQVAPGAGQRARAGGRDRGRGLSARPRGRGGVRGRPGGCARRSRARRPHRRPRGQRRPRPLAVEHRRRRGRNLGHRCRRRDNLAHRSAYADPRANLQHGLDADRHRGRRGRCLGRERVPGCPQPGELSDERVSPRPGDRRRGCHDQAAGRRRPRVLPGRRVQPAAHCGHPHGGLGGESRPDGVTDRPTHEPAGGHDRGRAGGGYRRGRRRGLGDRVGRRDRDRSANECRVAEDPGRRGEHERAGPGRGFGVGGRSRRGQRLAGVPGPGAGAAADPARAGGALARVRSRRALGYERGRRQGLPDRSPHQRGGGCQPHDRAAAGGRRRRRHLGHGARPAVRAGDAAGLQPAARSPPARAGRSS